MSTDIDSRLRLSGYLLLLALAWLAPSNSLASPCSEAVQGVIAWDGREETRWQPENVDTLCRGAEQSLEPARCFRRVMSDKINWGGGSRWNPRNALNLCRATTDANATLRCFMDGIARGDHWREAIAECQSSVEAAVGATQMPPADDRGLPTAHSFGRRSGGFAIGDEAIYRIECNNCQALYCAPGDEIVSHGGACEFGTLARQNIKQAFPGPCAGVGCWTVNLSCRDAQLKPLTVIESRSSIQARCLDVK